MMSSFEDRKSETGIGTSLRSNSSKFDYIFDALSAAKSETNRARPTNKHNAEL